MTVNAVPYVEQALSHPADNFRRAARFLAHGQQGVRDNVSGDLAVSQNGTPNMSVNVAAGEALINGTQNVVSQGAYEMLNDATVNLAIAASDPTNPRIDIVCASIQDAAYSGASNQALLQVVTGTPAPSPSPPATPANSIVLAQVAVAANATSIVSGNITDKRPIFRSLFRAKARGTTVTSLTSSATVKIGLQTIDYDPNGNFDAVTNFRYTIPVAGYYAIQGMISRDAANAASTFLSIQFFKNGSALSSAVNTTLARGGGAISTEVALAFTDLFAAGDFVELFGFSDAATLNTLNGAPNQPFLAINYVG